MDRLKKLNGSMIAAIVLSVLLIMSITTGATLAWFASRDSATNSLTMGEAVVVTIGEDYKQGNGELAMNLPVDKATNGLLPGMSVTPNIKVQLQKSNTNALLRARFITTVEYPNYYVDEAFKNKEKYPDGFATTDGVTPDNYKGRVLTEEATTIFKSAGGVAPVYEGGKITNYSATGVEYVDAYGAKVYITSADLKDASGYTKVFKYNVFAGNIIYDYYNYLGQRIDSSGNKIEDPLVHTKTVHLNRVEVRKTIVDAIGSTFTVNGIAVEVSNENAAELEIRQRGVDLTNAINRVLQGQRGYNIDPTTGNIYDDETHGIKYTRRVADGWAYRDADQAWYYMGSQTNGFVIADNTSGTSEVIADPKQPIANDITKYDPVKTGNVTVQQPTYELLSSGTNPYKTTVTTNGSNNNDMTRNYLGGTSADAVIDRISNEKAVLSEKTIASVDLSQGDVSIDFLTKRFVLPTFINNNYAKAKVTFTFTVEAVQDYLIDPLQESTAAADRLPNNLVNAILVFNNAFPQSLYPKSTDNLDRLRATGSTSNVIPGGGESVKWNTTTGTAAVEFNDMFDASKPSVEVVMKGEDGHKYIASINPTNDVIGAEGNQYSYGHLKDETIGLTGIKGFAVKTDEYGDQVADYTKEAAYQRGTASSIGVCPFKVVTP